MFGLEGQRIVFERYQKARRRGRELRGYRFRSALNPLFGDRVICGHHHREGTSRFNSSAQFRTTFRRPELDSFLIIRNRCPSGATS